MWKQLFRIGQTPPGSCVINARGKSVVTAKSEDAEKHDHRGKEGFFPAYSAWVGKPVVMLVIIRDCHVPVQCRIVGESAADVRVRIPPGWEMNVLKELILAVEDDRISEPLAVN